MADPRPPRVIRLVHELPGRVRLRLVWLREAPGEAVPLADALATLDASMEVRVRPWTGSVLCSFDPDALRTEDILAALRHHTGVAIVLRPGETHPEVEDELRRRTRHGVSSVRRAVTRSFHDLNQQVLHSTEGRLDLGAVTGLGFLGLGAVEVMSSRLLPAPPWFNLAWWAFRTFTISGENGDEQEDDIADEGLADVPPE